MMNMEVNGTTIQVKLYQNSSAEAVKELLQKGPFTIEMKDYAHMEKFGSFGMQFPTNDETITTEAGDVILSEGNLLVIYYAPNTWNFTRLGKGPEPVRDGTESRCLEKEVHYGGPDVCRTTNKNRKEGEAWRPLPFIPGVSMLFLFFIHVPLSRGAFLQSSDHRGLRFRCVRDPVLRFRSYRLH